MGQPYRTQALSSARRIKLSMAACGLECDSSVEEQPTCSRCSAEFGVFTWRYTCKTCERDVCDDCLVSVEGIDEKMCRSCQERQQARLRDATAGVRVDSEGRLNCVGVPMSMESAPGDCQQDEAISRALQEEFDRETRRRGVSAARLHGHVNDYRCGCCGLIARNAVDSNGIFTCPGCGAPNVAAGQVHHYTPDYLYSHYGHRRYYY